MSAKKPVPKVESPQGRIVEEKLELIWKKEEEKLERDRQIYFEANNNDS